MPLLRSWVLALLGTSLAALVVLVVSLNVHGLREVLLGRANPPPIESLAVLPLENLSGDAAQEYFADGITDQLTTNLAQIGALRAYSGETDRSFRSEPDHHSGGIRSGVGVATLAFRLCCKVIGFVK